MLFHLRSLSVLLDNRFGQLSPRVERNLYKIFCFLSWSHVVSLLRVLVCDIFLALVWLRAYFKGQFQEKGFSKDTFLFLFFFEQFVWGYAAQKY